MFEETLSKIRMMFMVRHGRDKTSVLSCVRVVKLRSVSEGGRKVRRRQVWAKGNEHREIEKNTQTKQTPETGGLVLARHLCGYNISESLSVVDLRKNGR